tara:strand:- start:2795 stop:3049 length:255 start_codon:yes stop_codon:yes gene_type:complete
MTEATTREIKLTDDQFDMLKKVNSEITIARKMLGEVMATAIEQAAEREQDFWDSVQELAGAVTEESYQINWLTRKIVVKKVDEE